MDMQQQEKANANGLTKVSLQRKKAAVLIDHRRADGQSSGRPVIQRGAIYHLANITNSAEQRAQITGTQDALKYAHQQGELPALLNEVFEHAPKKDLEVLPEHGALNQWQTLLITRRALGASMFSSWLGRVGFHVNDIPEMKMLLTDRSAQGAHQRAGQIMALANHVPQFKGMSYDNIAHTLGVQGFRRQEKYTSISDHDDVLYGQDVWTHDDGQVVRIKVGGRSINGRFPRPPHVVKEVTSTPHSFRPADIVAKTTDDGTLIPAGTKYSAKDLQTWYMQKTKAVLAPNAWRNPEASGDPGFIELFQRWTEGAHTPIGTVPGIPRHLTSRQIQMVGFFRKAKGIVQNFVDFTQGPLFNVVDRRANHPTIKSDLLAINRSCKKAVLDSLSVAEDVVYESNFKIFYKKLRVVKNKLETWVNKLNEYFNSTPPVKKNKPFYANLFEEAKQSLRAYNRSKWDSLNMK